MFKLPEVMNVYRSKHWIKTKPQRSNLQKQNRQRTSSQFISWAKVPTRRLLLGTAIEYSHRQRYAHSKILTTIRSDVIRLSVSQIIYRQEPTQLDRVGQRSRRKLLFVGPQSRWLPHNRLHQICINYWNAFAGLQRHSSNPCTPKTKQYKRTEDGDFGSTNIVQFYVDRPPYTQKPFWSRHYVARMSVI